MASPSVARRGLAAIAVLVAAGGLLVACTGGPSTSAQQRAAQRFLDAVAARRVDAAAALTSAPADAQAAIGASLGGLGSSARGTLKAGRVSTSGASATVRFAASWTLAAARAPWRYDGSLPLRKKGETWQVVWAPTDLNPGLTTETHLLVRRLQPARAALEDSAGRPLFVQTPVVHVGLEKKLVTNLKTLAAALAAVPQLQTTQAEVTTAVTKAAPTDFVPVITLRRPVYESIKAKIYDLPGTVFQSDSVLLGPSATFGQPLLGSVGDATAAQISASKGRLVAGDQVGDGGLQEALDTTLGGSADTSVVAATYGENRQVRVLHTLVTGRPGTAVTLTLDRATQAAADAALAGVTRPAAVVVVQRSTGRVLADANSAAATYDLGLNGAFPAGSTFKIVTYSAAFAAKPTLTPRTTIACPATTVVDGRRFENENGFSYPPIPVRNAFGYSCNTSAITTAMSLPDDALRSAATSLGLGATWALPVPAFSGSLPLPSGATEKAADAIGQGRVLVSPLLMALIAGNASSGVPVTPSLVAGAAVVHGAPIPATRTADMNSLMQATVDLPAGTAHALAALGGVEGKTGTAEFGTATPPDSHSWFAGVRGDLAVAVFVYGGDTAKVPAVPIARDLLGRLS